MPFRKTLFSKSSPRPKSQTPSCEPLEQRGYLSAVSFLPSAAIFAPASGITPIAEVAADFGNGNADVAALYAAGGAAQQSIAILLNNGHGAFTSAQTLTAGNESKVIRLADIFGNGRPDILVSSVLDGKLLIYDANGDGTYHDTPQGLEYGSPQGTTPLAATNDFQVSDLTGNNGLPDIVIADDVKHDTVVLMNQGGSFTESILPISLTNFVIGDFTGDGKPDIAYINGSSLGVLAGHGDGTFTTTPVNYSLNIPASFKTTGNIITGDFTGSGRTDVAVELQNNTASSPGAVSVLISLAGGGFSTAKISATPANPIGITAGDFNGDGKQDILVAGSSASDALLSNGDGSFSDEKLSLTNATGTNQSAVADFNNDGKLDFVAGDGANGLYIYPNGAVPPSVLVPTVSGTVPATPFIAGQKIKPFKQTVKVTNNSAAMKVDFITVSMLVSPSPDGTGGSVVASFKTHAKLKPHQALTVPLMIKSLPAGLTGTLYLVGQVVDVTGVLNVAAAAHTISVGPPTTDLSATVAKIPTTAKAGKPATVTLSVNQLGNIPITGALPVEFFLSTDTALDSADINLGTLLARVSLKPGKPSKITLFPKIAAGVTGSYHLIAVVDPQNTKADTNLANNTAVSSGVIQVS